MSEIIFEPFKIKSVEALHLSSPEDRQRWIMDAHYNVFNLRSEQVLIDLLTDSGTSAMSDLQWAGMLKADESYAGSRSFLDLEKTVKDLTGMEHVIPVHQGRAAEHLLFGALLKPGQIVLSNGLFDTTRANIEVTGATGKNLPCTEAQDPFLVSPFKGNIDLEALDRELKANQAAVAFVLMTITNNTGGGQPVSLENLKEAKQVAKKYGKLFILDACRFAENSALIRQRESGMQKLSSREIARRCFDLADALTFSGKKDALSNIGGLICLRQAELSSEIKNRMVVVEGFPTYGGLAGYSMEAMNQGLKEVLDEKYLEYRLRTISWMLEKLVAAGVPAVQPAGGHAIYLESSKFLPQIKRENLPGISLACELYIQSGIRVCELGTVAFGSRDKEGKQVFPALDLVRLAIPRRVYTEAHMGYVAQELIKLFHRRDTLRPFDFLEEAKILRHFRSKFRPL